MAAIITVPEMPSRRPPTCWRCVPGMWSGWKVPPDWGLPGSGSRCWPGRRGPAGWWWWTLGGGYAHWRRGRWGFRPDRLTVSGAVMRPVAAGRRNSARRGQGDLRRSSPRRPGSGVTTSRRQGPGAGRTVILRPIDGRLPSGLAYCGCGSARTCGRAPERDTDVWTAAPSSSNYPGRRIG